MALKVKHVTFTGPVKPPGASPSQPNYGIDSASMSSDHYEMYKIGDELWVIKEDKVISVPLSSCRRIEYFKLEETPVYRVREEPAQPKAQVGRPKGV
jgi:hypothetical protein